MPIIDIPWHSPVSVKLQNGATRRFSGAYDALDFLENEWPVRKGEHYERARGLCQAALTRSISTEVAREAFIASCLEAALPLVTDAHVPAARRRHINIAA